MSQSKRWFAVFGSVLLVGAFAAGCTPADTDETSSDGEVTRTVDADEGPNRDAAIAACEEMYVYMYEGVTSLGDPSDLDGSIRVAEERAASASDLHDRLSGTGQPSESTTAQSGLVEAAAFFRDAFDDAAALVGEAESREEADRLLEGLWTETFESGYRQANSQVDAMIEELGMDRDEILLGAGLIVAEDAIDPDEREECFAHQASIGEAVKAYLADGGAADELGGWRYELVLTPKYLDTPPECPSGGLYSYALDAPEPLHCTHHGGAQ